MLNDLIFVSSVLVLVAVIAVERLFKIRQQVCSDAKVSQSPSVAWRWARCV